MRDDLNPQGGTGDAGRNRLRRPFDAEVPLSDREVPLESASSSDVINRWLDGEIPEPTTLRGDAARHVEFWRRIGEETTLRRQVVTPAHVKAQIMASLPVAAPVAVDGWWQRPIEVSPVAAVAAALGLLALGAVLSVIIG
jgi:hypothetical protein